MKDGDRNPAPPLAHFPGPNDFCVCRVVGECGLTTIESFNKLRTARTYMHRIAAGVPGSYLVFSKTSRQVLGKVMRRAEG